MQGYQAAAALETATSRGEDTDAPTSMGLLKNIPITSGEDAVVVLLANYKSDGDGLFQVEPGILAGVSSLSDIQEGQGGDDRPYPVPTEREPADVSYQDGGDQSEHQAPRGLPETCGGENHGQPENRGLTFVPGTWRVGNVPASTFVTRACQGQ